ncbi:MAG: carboxypeptidase-like regulatory domain-containing protein, partial [Chitinispirillaceae bacterium]|nr:carboxypeptidase-like regulatory domain-containing protein [Chitinispirillaceae bacterium]
MPFYKISGQPADTVVSGSFNNTPFVDFVEEIENNTSLRFYFISDWVKEIRITASGNNLSLGKILDAKLKELGMQLYREGNSIFIFPGEGIVTELPSFIQAAKTSGIEQDTVDITSAEKKYQESKMTAARTVLEIGNKKLNKENSKCLVNGKIIDKTNSEPLIGATVYIGELKTGAVTDLDGRFKLTLKPGRYQVAVDYVSMKRQEFIFQVYSSGSVTIELKKSLIELGEVTISANRYDHVKGMQMGYDRITSKTIKEIPVVLGEKDILRVAQMLPGVLNVGEGSSGFNVRGSSADQNMFYINKIPVYNTSHLFGFFTSFSPDIVSDFTLYKGNIPASYGGRLSSVFNITTRQGSKKKFFSQGGVSPVTAHFSLEAPVIKNKLSMVTSFRSSYSDWILKKIKDPDISKSNAFFCDGTLSANAEINDKNLLKAFMYVSNDRFSLSAKNDYQYANKGSSLVWKHVFSSSLSVDIAAVFSSYSYENTNKVNLSTAFTQSYQIDHYETRADFNLQNTSDHKLEFGVSNIYYDLDRGDIEPFGEE